MNKKIFIGTTLAVIIVFARFSTLASAQSTSLKDSLLTKIKAKIDWKPGDIIGSILGLIGLIFLILFGWMFP
ncbi:MAG: hypothetical protein V1726_05300 [Methanobacteriota archaeon]